MKRLNNRHSWHSVTSHKKLCRHCGMVKLQVPSYGRWGTLFERNGWTTGGAGASPKTPICDQTWPAGWKPDGFETIHNQEAA